MRALVVAPGPQFSVLDVYAGYVEALEELLGVDNVDTFDIHLVLNAFSGIQRATDGGDPEVVFDDQGVVKLAAEHLTAAAYRWWPELIVFVSGFFILPDTLRLLRSRGHKLAMIHTESPYEEPAQLRRAELVDVNIVNDPINLDSYRAIGPAAYLPHAYRPTVHSPGPALGGYQSDVCFIGTAYPERVELLSTVNWSGIDLALGGNWRMLDEGHHLLRHLAHETDTCIDNDQTVNAYRSAKIAPNIYRQQHMDGGHDVGWSMGPREVEIAAVGGAMLARQPRTEGDELFPFLPTFTDAAELEDVCRYYLVHDDERSDAVLKAREAVADRTFTNNAGELLRLAGF
jgi:spore maturation protein CgeB